MDNVIERFIFMKVGNHAGENWESILERKRQELINTGRIFWGYGGTVCHPINQIQPFARLSVETSGQIGLVFEPINSKADPELYPAKEYSVDGIHWEKLPTGILVTGSRYALVLDEITETDLEVDLSQFEVGIGPSRGKTAADYIQGRIDKGCFVRKSFLSGAIENNNIHKIKYTTKLQDPYAVLLRS